MLAKMPDRGRQTLEREFLEFAPDAVIGVDEMGEIRLANSRTQAVFGYDRDELIGQPVEMLVPKSAHGAHIAHRDRYFQAPRTRPMGEGIDLKARRKDGSEFPCEISLSAVATDDGMMALAAIRDITDRRRDRDDLRRAVRRLQAATDVAIAVGGETDLERVLEAIVERGRSLVEARALIILLREGNDLVVGATAAVAGGLDPKVSGLRLPAKDATERMVLGSFTGADLGAKESGRALIAPLLFRGIPSGWWSPSIASATPIASTTRTSACSRPSRRAPPPAWPPPARWRRSGCRTRSTRPSRSAAGGRESSTTRPSRRWRCSACGSPRRSATTRLDGLQETGQAAVEQIDDEIVKLRRLISELRPASLDTIGLEAALEALAEQHSEAAHFTVDCVSCSCRARKRRGRPPCSRPPSTGSSRRRSTTSPSTRWRDGRPLPSGPLAD